MGDHAFLIFFPQDVVDEISCILNGIADLAKSLVHM